MSALPLFEGKSVDWIPVDVAAGTIVDILLQGRKQEVLAGKEEAEEVKEMYNVHNIVNPHTIPWSSLVDMLQTSRQNNSQEKLQEISMKEWTNRLVGLSSSTMPNQTTPLPGLRLLQFFEDMAASERTESEKAGQANQSKVFQTEKTRGISESLRGCEVFNGECVEAYVRVWREGGFLS